METTSTTMVATPKGEAFLRAFDFLMHLKRPMASDIGKRYATRAEYEEARAQFFADVSKFLCFCSKEDRKRYSKERIEDCAEAIIADAMAYLIEQLKKEPDIAREL